MWLKLLHYDRRGQRSEIVSDEFFLSPGGKTDSLAELESTLAAYSQPWPTDANSHPRCRFPARYFWLSQRIKLSGYVVREPRCQRLEKWASFDRLRSASLLLVSGYLGNPASTFGHSLLRLNTDELDDANMLDATMNFGALVPEKESMPLYMYRGLSGGYMSGFSSGHFYADDFVYARSELRDLWEYELDLSDDQLKLLVFHLWELTGMKFHYYFLTKNCGYRFAELLELIEGEPWLDNTRFWYAPVEMFHRLHALDAARSKRLIRSIRFIPSSQRELRHQFSLLSPAEVLAANSVIHEAGKNITAQSSRFSEKRQIVLSDALLAYYEYRLAAQGGHPSPEARAAKDIVLRERLRLPAATESDALSPVLPSPAQLSAPMLTAVGVGADAAGQQYARAEFSPFSYEQVGSNGLDNGELAVLDTAGGVDNHKRLILDRFDVVRLRKLNTDHIEIAGESSWSWQTRIGAARVRRDERDHIDSFASFGAGKAAQWRSFVAYAMVDGSVQTGPSAISAEPNLGVIAGIGRWKSWVQTGIRYDVGVGQWRLRLEAAARYQLTQNQAIHLEFIRDYETRRAVLSFNQYW